MPESEKSHLRLDRHEDSRSSSTTGGEHLILSPLSGPVLSLQEIPDKVFSNGLVGNGLAIDPVIGCIYSPFNGRVIQLHSSHHAITLESDSGIQLLIHIGLDTVKLKGEGFVPLVKLGDIVTTGCPLIEFDIDFLALHAKSLISPVLVLEPTVASINQVSNTSVAAQTPLFSFNVSAEKKSSRENSHSTSKDQQSSKSEEILITDPTGLHARPAAVIAGCAKKFQSDIQLLKGDQHANAKSVLSIMSLEVGGHEKVRFSAHGSDAEEALKTIVQELNRALNNVNSPKKPSPTTKPSSPRGIERQVSSNENELTGLQASPGIAIGQVVQMKNEDIEVDEYGGDFKTEETRLKNAIDAAKVQLSDLQKIPSESSDETRAMIFAAHAELLEDPDLLTLTWQHMHNGKSAAFAWKTAINNHAELIESLSNEVLAARGNDLRDVGRRVLRLLSPQNSQGVASQNTSFETEGPTIVIATHLTPSDTASLDRNKVVGFCTVDGGTTSHVAILARSMGIPAIVGIDERALLIKDGTEVILNADTSTLHSSPSKQDIEKIKVEKERQDRVHQEELAQTHQPATTRDGHNIEVAANIGNATDSLKAVELGGDGVGLLRSEFLFLDRQEAPSEDEQLQVYQKITDTLEHRPLIIRTLDVGGDKPLAYLPLPTEENPFLGERGLRLSFAKPELFRSQIRAVLRVQRRGLLRLMFPMVSSLDEFLAAKKIVEEERSQLAAPPIEIGVMIEIPSAALTADTLAREVDFFSIGTNDLAQYTLAMDRGHPQLARKIDAFHPAVLKLIDMTVQAAQTHGKWVGVCGSIASEALAAPILLGLGVNELSVSAPSLPTIKAKVRQLHLESCKNLAQEALKLADGTAVRALCAEYLEKIDREGER